MDGGAVVTPSPEQVNDQVRERARLAYVGGLKAGRGGRLPAVKAIREETGLGLRESLQLVKSWEVEGFLPHQEDSRALDERLVRRVRAEIQRMAEEVAAELGVETRYVYAEIVYHSTRMARESRP